MSVNSAHDSSRRSVGIRVLIAGVVLLTTSPADAVTFNFVEGQDLQNSPFRSQVLNGFQEAANFFSSQFTDNVTINIDINYAPLGPNVLGSASSATAGFFYEDVRSALSSNSMSASDAVATANLPGSSTISFRTNARDGSVILDNNGSGNNFVLDVNRANAKALGLSLGNPAASDASITFSSEFAFDFDRTNGISSNAFDFVGIAIHEIGHALGFVSGVDVVDYFSGPNGPGRFDDLNGTASGIGTLDNFRVFSVLDLFRYSTAGNLMSLATGVADLLDLAYGGTPYFSIDGGLTSLGLFSTGDFNGDGWQASHWKDDLNLGIMDPSFAPGEFGDVTALDLTAFDVIGWDLAVTPVPEPSSIVLVAIGVACVAGQRLRSRRKRPG